jgi:gliding motility-associated-like protein
MVVRKFQSPQKINRFLALILCTIKDISRMNRFKLLIIMVFGLFAFLAVDDAMAQISSNAEEIVQTSYSSGQQDEIHVFCGAKDHRNAALTANSPNNENGSFEWSKYNGSTFVVFQTESGTSSVVTQLEDGLYRVRIITSAGESIDNVWVFNNYIEVTASIPKSDCNSFTLVGTVDGADFVYTDMSTGAPIELPNKYLVSWTVDDNTFSSFATQPVYNIPTKNTMYTFEAVDDYTCSASEDIEYISIVTKASFKYEPEDQGEYNDPNKLEAPLTVNFTNASENGTPGEFEWFVFKDLDLIKEEIEAGVFEDSIMEKVYSDNMIFTFEACGTYMVKLVSKKISENNVTCTDTFYMDDYIVIDTSFIEAPNVFTPGNGDEINNTFAINFFSMKSLKVTILNRWGKVLHVWENNNIPGYSKTVTESVWDGKIGGKYASPGVYYYVVEGIGRDDKRRKQAGFFHLFRDK